jgi:hypothetical protein
MKITQLNQETVTKLIDRRADEASNDYSTKL